MKSGDGSPIEVARQRLGGSERPEVALFCHAQNFFGAIWCDLVRLGAKPLFFAVGAWDRSLAASMQQRTADPPTPRLRRAGER
jgi:hypothetical protein